MINEVSKRNALASEIHELNEWVLELFNERLVAEKDRKEARANERAAMRNERAAQMKSMRIESKYKALESEVEGLNQCLFELDNKRKAAEKHHESVKKMYMHAKSEAYLRLQKFREERLARKEVEDNLICVKKALCKTEQELKMAKLLMEQCHATKCKMKKEWAKNFVDGQRTRGGSRHWSPWVVQMICELLINGNAPTAVPSTIQSIYETLYNESPEELPSVNFVREC